MVSTTVDGHSPRASSQRQRPQQQPPPQQQQQQRQRSSSVSTSLGFDPRETNLRSWLTCWPGILKQLDALATGLRRRQVTGPFDCAKCTVELLRSVVGTCKWHNAKQLMGVVKEIGREIMAAKPTELAVGNMVRRVLFIIREEYANLDSSERSSAEKREDGAAKGEVGAPSLESVLGGSAGELDYTEVYLELKANIIEGLTELKDDIDESNASICDSAADTIHANEVILTFGYSAAVGAFLKAAARHLHKAGLTFQVIVMEAAPSLLGHKLAVELSKGEGGFAGVETTVIPDSAVFAIMARVNKVILPCHAVVANGGLVSSSGCHVAALAAKELSVPVVCVTGLYKLCPLFPHDQDTFNTLLAPSAVMSHPVYDQLASVDVVNPAYDYVPPGLVGLYITNAGGHQPSYIYRLMSEYYHRDDRLLD